MVSPLLSLQKAIDYIERHIDDKLSINEIAQVAGYSPYHLTRIFTATIGEPIGSYIQKRRLSIAAKKLLYSNKRVIDIAMESGFGSSEAFSRAFKSLYYVSPANYRKNGVERYFGNKFMLDYDRLRHLFYEITINPTFVDIPEICIAGIRGSFTSNQISKNENALYLLWQKALIYYPQLQLKPNARGFGICETLLSQTAVMPNNDIHFSQIVGFEVEPNTTIPECMALKKIPAGRFAVFTHTGTVYNLRKTYDYIMGSWVLFSKETLDNREDFELYDARFKGPDNENSQIDIYIPIK